MKQHPHNLPKFQSVKSVALTFGVIALSFGLLAPLVQFLAVTAIAGETAEQSKAVNDARVSAIQLLAAIGLGGGFFYTVKTFGLARHTQRAERFTKAIGHIGDQGSEAIRVGGVHSLKLLALEEPLYWPVAEQILSALVRERAKPGIGLTADVHAALAVIGDRPAQSSSNRSPLDLRRVHLPKVNLVGANLERVWLDEAFLDGCDLTDARLGNARLTDADLNKAVLSNADLTACDLTAARFRGANFYKTTISSAEVSRADFSGALNLSRDELKETSGEPLAFP